MKVTHTRQFPSYEAAKAHLSERGKLEFFGTEGYRPMAYVYVLTVHDGRKYRLFLYDDGKVDVME